MKGSYINTPYKPHRGQQTNPEFRKAQLIKHKRINFKALVLSLAKKMK